MAVTDADGNILSDLEVSVTVKIPWWKTALKICGYVLILLVALIVLAYIRLIITSSKKRKRRLEKRHRS